MRRAYNPHTKSRITFRTNWLVVVERMNIADFGFSLIFGSARFTALRAYPFCFFTLGWASFLASLVSFAVFATYEGFTLCGADFTISLFKPKKVCFRSSY